MPGREHSYRAEAVVLRHSDYGEADRLLTLYTKETGKARVIAKGVRKIRSRKAGHLEPFTRVTLQLAQARDMPIVTQAETIDAYLPIREDLMRTSYAAYIVEMLDRFTYEEGENRAIFKLLTDSLTRIASLADPFITLRYYEIHLLEDLGFRPELFYCVSCHAEIQPADQYFSFAQGGVYCPKCGVNRPDLLPVSLNALKFLRHLQRSTFEEASRAQIPSAVRTEIESLLQQYLTYLLERTLNTPAFIRQVRPGGSANPG
jgi:DNA repair protein RecO (recombination protein O)